MLEWQGLIIALTFFGVLSAIYAARHRLPKLRLPRLPKLRRKKEEPQIEKMERREPIEHTHIKEEISQMVERVRQATERAKILEEKYNELKFEMEKTKKEKNELEEKLKKKDEEIKDVTKEANKLVKWMAHRFKKGQYVPVVLWTKRGNPMVLKFVCSIAYINGGWRALLVDRLTDKPEKGQWYPPLDKPGADFIFRDQKGFNPDDPNHTVLFDINLYDWEDDLKITKSDPEAKAVAFIAGVDEDGNPVHRLEFGAPIDIRKLRAENRALKRQVGALSYRLSKREEELWDARYRLETERDKREHLERENKLLKMRLEELGEVLTIQVDESEIMRTFARAMKRREYAFKKQFRELEDEYVADVITPRLKGIPGYEYFEHAGQEAQMKIISLLYPIALTESKRFDIETQGKSMYDVVSEWLKEKYDKEGKDLAQVLEDYGLRDRVIGLLSGGEELV